MADFGDLVGYFQPGLKLRVKGTDYTVPLPSADLGLWCRAIMQMAGEISEASTEEELAIAAGRARDRAVDLPPVPGGGKASFERLFLGDALDAMMSDGLEYPYIQMCAETAYIWVTLGCGQAAEDRAAAYWRSGGRPEARGPANRAERRASTQKTNTAAAVATPSQASTPGTSSRPRSGGRGRGRGSRGRRS